MEGYAKSRERIEGWRGLNGLIEAGPILQALAPAADVKCIARH